MLALEQENPSGRTGHVLLSIELHAGAGPLHRPRGCWGALPLCQPALPRAAVQKRQRCPGCVWPGPPARLLLLPLAPIPCPRLLVRSSPSTSVHPWMKFTSDLQQSPEEPVRQTSPAAMLSPLSKDRCYKHCRMDRAFSLCRWVPALRPLSFPSRPW